MLPKARTMVPALFDEPIQTTSTEATSATTPTPILLRTVRIVPSLHQTLQRAYGYTTSERLHRDGGCVGSCNVYDDLIHYIDVHLKGMKDGRSL